MQRNLTSLDKTITSTVTMSCSFSTTFHLQILWCTYVFIICYTADAATTTITTTILCPLYTTGQPVLAGTPSSELEMFVGAKFYCLHALDDRN